MQLTELSETSLDFPPVSLALTHPNGLLAYGGDLRPERLLRAYQHGIFPWFTQGEPLLWWSPDPRAILWPEQLHISRSARKFLRSAPYQATLNRDFPAVIRQCAISRQGATWITRAIEHAYVALHYQGVAHSVEIWQENKLVGGLYGVAQGALFCGESMFSHADHASRMAISVFCQHFIAHGGKLIDCQSLNAHTASLGACEIERSTFLSYLAELQQKKLSTDCWQTQILPA
ncbi:MAG: leucyl/phenylalanyl-tRNA--protein transferase [Enterobacteriaceae bacterium]